MARIPKKLHFVWVGDEKKLPATCIETWRRNHPDYQLKVWGNRELESTQWRTQHHIEKMISTGRPWCGVADLMRWEILAREGGIALDADSVSLDRLPDWLLDCGLFSCWENEVVKPGLVANGYVGAVEKHPLICRLVDRFAIDRHLIGRFLWRKMRYKKVPPWKATGPEPFTREIMNSRDGITILPSHFFIPVHYSGRAYMGSGPVYACEFFSSTNKELSEDCVSGEATALVDSAWDYLRKRRAEFFG
jgi:inositol phosphorylceramide mannosyltransferase catalytic subunit